MRRLRPTVGTRFPFLVKAGSQPAGDLPQGRRGYQAAIQRGNHCNPNKEQSLTPTVPLLSGLFAKRRERAERTCAWSPKRADDYQQWTGLFIELCGDREVLDY